MKMNYLGIGAWVAAIATTALAACGGQVNLGAVPDGGAGGDDDHAAGDDGGGNTNGDAAGDAGSFTAPQVQAATAVCSLPHGPAVTLSTYGDVRAQLVGAWLLCPDTQPVTVYSPAIVFTPDGHWYHLLPDGAGGLVAGSGVDNQGTYFWENGSSDSTPVNGFASPTVSAASGGFTPDSYGDGPMSFETSPKRMHTVITYLDQTIEQWLVPLP